MENPSAVLYGKEDVRIEDRKVEELKDDEVEVTMFGVGLCGSDTYMYSQGSHGDQKVTEPHILGHEGCGRVTKVGKGVHSLSVGDRVTIEPGDRCNNCKRCNQGRHHTCLTLRPSEAPLEGYIARKRILPEWACWRLPESLSDEDGALMEPLAVAVHACRRAEIAPGKSVLVLGAGCIGQLIMMVARAMGATNVCITDVIEARLDVATSLGAPMQYLTKSRDMDQVTSDLVRLLGEEPDITMECSGNMWCQQLALKATSSGGLVMFIGYSRSEVELPISVAARREIDMKTVYRYDRQCFPIAIELAAMGKVKLSPLISHRFPLEKTEDALKLACARDPGVMKVLVKCQKQ